MSAPPRTAPPGPERLAPPPLRGGGTELTPLARPAGIGSYVAALRRRPRLVVGLPLLFALVALAFAIPRPRFYEARAAWYVESTPRFAANWREIFGQLYRCLRRNVNFVLE